MAKKKQPAHIELTGCNFVGVQFDAAAVDAVSKIADGLIENAKGLRALAEVLKASNVNIECLLKLQAPELTSTTPRTS